MCCVQDHRQDFMEETRKSSHSSFLKNLCVVCVCSHTLSHVCLLETLWTVAHQAPLSMGFSRQEYQNGLSFPSPVDLPDPGFKSTSPVSPELAGRFFTLVSPGKLKRFKAN